MICALFIPLIIANTASRMRLFSPRVGSCRSAYPRMARNRVFIVPVCLDATPEAARMSRSRFDGAVDAACPRRHAAALFERVKRLLAPSLRPQASTPPACRPA